MDSITLLTTLISIVALTYVLLRKRPKAHITQDFKPSDSHYSVYQSPKVNGSKSLTLVLEENRIDELGYQIYKSQLADLDKIDILIRNNQTGEVMKIVKDGDSESMIGVIHPEKGHIGYLQYDTLNVNDI